MSANSEWRPRLRHEWARGGGVLLVEEGVVVLRGVEGRVEIDQIDGLVLQAPPQDVEVVAVVEGAHVRRLDNTGVVRQSFMSAIVVAMCSASYYDLREAGLRC